LAARAHGPPRNDQERVFFFVFFEAGAVFAVRVVFGAAVAVFFLVVVFFRTGLAPPCSTHAWNRRCASTPAPALTWRASHAET